MKYKGNYVAAPVNVHRVNWMWANVAVLKKSGVAGMPRTWDEFFADADKIKKAGFIAVATGGNSWNDFTTFEPVALGVGGVKFYEDAFVKLDPKALNGPAMKKALLTFRKLKGYIDPGAVGRDWNLATAMVIQEKAGFQFMGDWAKGEFINAGKTLGTDYGCALAPGSDGMVIIGDAMAFPKTGKAEQDKAQALLAEVITDPKIQVEFAKKKGSFPVRKDVDTSSLDACAQKGVALLAAGKVAPEHAIIISPAKGGAITDLIGEFWANPAMTGDEVVEKFAAAVTEG
jgi:glucose/mannose transport system substrate-binding protein